MKRQTRLVLEALRDRPFGGLSPAEARDLIGTDRLAARVGELRADGFDVTTTYETAPSGSRYARYHLIEAPVQLTFDGQRDARAGSAPVLAAALPSDGRRAATAGSPGSS